MSSDKLREESVTADRDACFKELCCKAEGWEPEEGWGQEKTVPNTGESVARLDTRDRDPASGPRGMKRERRERMAGSHRFACGDRVSSRGQASSRRTDRSRLVTRKRESV